MSAAAAKRGNPQDRIAISSDRAEGRGQSSLEAAQATLLGRLLTRRTGDASHRAPVAVLLDAVHEEVGLVAGLACRGAGLRLDAEGDLAPDAAGRLEERVDLDMLLAALGVVDRRQE